MSLYPLLFKPIIKTKVWGSETWALSGYGDDQSVVANGFLKDNSLSDVLETYMDELVGDKVYRQYGNFFPLLFKFIDAKDDLSVQVHPSDDMAAQDGELGKTEMWYVTDADKEASIILGFNQYTSSQKVRESLQNNTLTGILQRTSVQKGDVAYIPAGTVHALCHGTKVAEIQETSDITYRLYDYNRPGMDGQLRPLHIEQSLAALDYRQSLTPLVDYHKNLEGAIPLVNDPHFTTSLLSLSEPHTRDYAPLDSFVVYICVEGKAVLHCNDEQCEDVIITEGDVVLMPAVINDVLITPKTATKLLEVYIR